MWPTAGLKKLRVLVALNKSDRHSQQQLIGVARRDLYLLSAELPFWQNFLKGMVGLWCNTMLILGIAVACSTYFSGVISLLVTLFFLITGALVNFIRELALGAGFGGGPLESANRPTNALPEASLPNTNALVVVGDAPIAGSDKTSTLSM